MTAILAGPAAGRPAAVIGFLDFATWFSHETILQHQNAVNST
jgi:hypothetical protein